MAESPAVMGRLKRVERDVAELKRTVVQISEVLVDLADRMDRGFKRVDDRLDRVDERFDTIGARLDRLITVTIEERTANTDRLRDIERRVSRLEERVGPAE
jgi:hypothetical protein